MSVLGKILRTGEGKTLKRLERRVLEINGFEPDMEALTDEQLAAKTVEFRERFEGGEELDELLPEAFAAVREAAKRTLGMRHFDVQLIGGMVLHEGRIAEMKTGEGKTLVATLPLYLNALAGVNVQLVTVNDYLARRDAAWMSPVYEALGVSVGVIQAMMPEDERRAAYSCDITYGTNSEFGFDYLRDNMAPSVEWTVQQRPLVRHRRRGRLHPDRRGPHAAHHLGRARGRRRDLLRLCPRRPRSRARERLRDRREDAHGRSHRGGRRPRSSARSASRTSTPPRTASS